MPFDPTLPEEDSPLSSAEMRAQLTGLRDLIDTIPQGDPGEPGPEGPPGEVSLMDLESAIAGTAMNPSAVDPLFLSIGDPPEQAEMQIVADKLDELINALKRVV